MLTRLIINTYNATEWVEERDGEIVAAEKSQWAVGLGLSTWRRQLHPASSVREETSLERGRRKSRDRRAA